MPQKILYKPRSESQEWRAIWIEQEWIVPPITMFNIYRPRFELQEWVCLLHIRDKRPQE